MTIGFLVVLLAAVGLGLAAFVRLRSTKKDTETVPRRSSGSGGGGWYSHPADGGYDANMNGPYGGSPVAGRDYPSSWHGPNEPGGSLDI